MFDSIAYRDQLIQLLPRGLAFARDSASNLAQLLHGMAAEMARVDARLFGLIEEADPRTTLELLGDWERVAGLPDTCTGAPDTISERRLALVNKISERGGQSIAYFVGLARRLGYVISIAEFAELEAGFAAGDDCNGLDWCFAWRVDVWLDDDLMQFALAEFCAGGDAGDLLAGFGALNLECLIGRAAPAHGELIFSYHTEPEPTFWFDFSRSE